MRWIGCAAIRDSTSRNQANGSTAFRLHIAMKLSNTAALLPALSLPKKVQFSRPTEDSRPGNSDIQSPCLPYSLRFNQFFNCPNVSVIPATIAGVNLHSEACCLQKL